MRARFALLLAVAAASLSFASLASAQQRYTDIGRVPGAWRDSKIAAAASNAIRTHGFYQPSSLTVNVTSGGRSGPGTVGHFTSISGPGATVNVPRGGSATFSMPAGVANRQLGTGPVRAPAGTTVTRRDVGGVAHFTVTNTSKR
jgi:hypothetical protein